MPPTANIIPLSLLALQSFRNKFGVDPSSQSTVEDGEKLLKIREELATQYNIAKDLIPEEFSK